MPKNVWIGLLEAINKQRKCHNATNLTIKDGLTTLAQGWTDNLAEKNPQAFFNNPNWVTLDDLCNSSPGDWSMVSHNGLNFFFTKKELFVSFVFLFYKGDGYCGEYIVASSSSGKFALDAATFQNLNSDSEIWVYEFEQCSAAVNANDKRLSVYNKFNKNNMSNIK